MINWSRYNTLFKSKRNGWLLYNSASNSFAQVDKGSLEFIRRIPNDPNVDFSSNPEIYFKLRQGGFLVEDGKDDDLFRILKMRRLTQAYAGNSMLLTIAPTKECNFACPYCFEKNRVPSKMSDATESSLIHFIEKHENVKNLYVTWYGGEPLLEFERMKSINKKLQLLEKKYNSMMITNGYLLNEEIISQLDDFKISLIQITVDGNKETHDSRRFLVEGGGTFDRIFENIDLLLKSCWKGKLNIRVNVDKTNYTEYMNVYKLVESKYPDKFEKQVTVYPGFVHGDEGSESGFFLDSKMKGDFLRDLAETHGVNALSVFPKIVMGGCTLTKRNSYVVGPDGELYKCWNDVGDESEVCGFIDNFTDWNMSLIAEGMIGASYLDDEKCKKCFYFPICDGGCPKVRVQNNRDGHKRDTCSYFKRNLKELLEIHYEQKTN